MFSKLLSTLAVSFFISTLAFAASVPQAGSVVQLGGSASDTASPSVFAPDSGQTGSAGYFTITCGALNGSFSAGSFWVCYKNGSKYAPANTKTAIISSYCATTLTAGQTFQFVQDNGATIGTNQTTALTTGVYQSGAAATYVHYLPNNNVERCWSSTISFSGGASNGQIGVQFSAATTGVVRAYVKEI